MYETKTCPPEKDIRKSKIASENQNAAEKGFRHVWILLYRWIEPKLFKLKKSTFESLGQLLWHILRYCLHVHRVIISFINSKYTINLWHFLRCILYFFLILSLFCLKFSYSRLRVVLKLFLFLPHYSYGIKIVLIKKSRGSK